MEANGPGDRTEDSVSTAFETQVERGQPLDFLRYVNLLGLPLVVIAFLFFVLSRRAEEAFNDNLEEEV